MKHYQFLNHIDQEKFELLKENVDLKEMKN